MCFLSRFERYLAMANSSVSIDTHTLAVVWNRTQKISSTGNVSYPESWLKVKLPGAEGSIASKFGKLHASPLQFKVTTAERDRDAKRTDTFYPKGKECAQLFCILGDVRITGIDMEDFDADKWTIRFPEGSLAKLRLLEYVDMVAKKQPEERALTKEEIKAAAKNRLQEEIVPTTPANVNGEALPA